MVLVIIFKQFLYKYHFKLLIRVPCFFPSQSRLLLFLEKRSIPQLQSRPHSENGSAPSGSCQHHLTPTVITWKKHAFYMSNSFTLICGRKKHNREQTTFTLTFWFKRKKHVGGVKTPPGCFFSLNQTPEIDSEGRNNTPTLVETAAKKEKKRLISCFQCFFGNCYIYFQVSCLPPPQEKVLHEVLIEISSM